MSEYSHNQKNDIGTFFIIHMIVKKVNTCFIWKGEIKMRLCDIIDIKSAFMEKTNLSEEEIQTIIDDIPTAFDGDKVVEQLKKKAIPVLDEDEHIMPESNIHETYEIKMAALSDIIDIVKAGGINE